MGRVIVQFELSNNSDLKLMERGFLTPEKVRKVAMQGVVDTGSTRLVLPPGVAALLGLPVTGQATIRYADHRREPRDVVGDAHVQLLGRGGVFSAVVEPARSDALLGAIVMEDLDLVVDCTGQRVEPRDPNGIFAEVE
jgi:predicted aspartyl protease